MQFVKLLIRTYTINIVHAFFIHYSRLYLLQSTLAQQEWRVPSLQHKLFKYINNHIAHSFKNVRERIGRYNTI